MRRHRAALVLVGPVVVVATASGALGAAGPAGPAASVVSAMPAVSVVSVVSVVSAVSAVSRPVVGAPPVAAPPLAAEALAGLAVKGRAPRTGYQRALYGKGWTDEDRDGCSTREEILQRDLAKKTYRRSGRCMVISTGVLQDPYTGRSSAFRRGVGTSSLVQIDHVVALLDSWQKGAQKLTPARRQAFANDPLNLLAVEGKVNQAKGASDAATWLPPAKGYRCAYVSRQVAVKAKYGLWVTAAEKAAIARILSGCPGQRLPG
jgi:hypothetical protein